MTYATITQLRQYAAERGLSLSEDDRDCQRLLVLSHDWIESQCYIGKPVSLDSAWPRSGISGIDADTVPGRVIAAECQAAIDAQAVDLMPTTDGRQIKTKELTGVMKTEYFEHTSAPDLAKAKALLKPFLRSSIGLSVGRL